MAEQFLARRKRIETGGVANYQRHIKMKRLYFTVFILILSISSLVENRQRQSPPSLSLQCRARALQNYGISPAVKPNPTRLGVWMWIRLGISTRLGTTNPRHRPYFTIWPSTNLHLTGQNFGARNGGKPWKKKPLWCGYRSHMFILGGPSIPLLL